MDKKVKTLLLNLPFNLNDVTDYGGVLQPYGLAVISSYLKQNGYDVTLFDAFAYHLERKKILQYIKELNPKIIGLPLMTNHLPQSIPFLRDVKLLIPDIITVVGGPHPSAEYKNIVKHHPEVDIAVKGEGEFVMGEIIDCVQDNKPFDHVSGIAFRSNGSFKANPTRDYIQDLESLPFADWDSLPMETYFDIWTIKKNYANVVLSRGCPFGCTFCGAKEALGQKQRRRSPEHILKEIELLYDRHHVRNLFFSDSTLNINNQWVNELCEGILKLNKPILWGCNIRADRVNRDTLKLMKKSGCAKIHIGVESADNKMLRDMKKGESIEQIEEGIRLTLEVGFYPYLGFIIGMPGETKSSILKSIKFVKKLKKCPCSFTLATPFPGTEFYEIAKREGFLIKDWSKFDQFKIAYVPKDLSKENLEKYYKRAVKNVYLSFYFLLNNLLQMKSWLNFKINIVNIYNIFFKRITRLKK